MLFRSLFSRSRDRDVCDFHLEMCSEQKKREKIIKCEKQKKKWWKNRANEVKK